MAIKVLINNIQPAFNNAHKLLWAKYNPNRNILKGRNVYRTQREWWKKEHQVEIIGDNVDFGNWQYIVFQNDSDLTYFMLKYS